MAKRFHWVNIQVFLRAGAPRFLNQLLPVSYDAFLEEQFFYDQEHKAKVYLLKHAKLEVQEAQGFDETISVYSFRFSKTSDTNAMFTQIMQSLSDDEKKELHESMYERVDEEGRFSIRLDQNALEQGMITLSKGGASVQIYFLLAAFPKNTHTIREATKKLFEEYS